MQNRGEEPVQLGLEPGREIGPSPWLVVNQDMIDRFGDVTLDPDPMHDDPEWATNNSPFGGTIAYGFLTISLLSHFMRSVGSAEGGGHFVNYGFEKLRLVEPVPVGARVRGRFVVASVSDERGRRRVTFDTTVEIEGSERPAMVAQWVVAHVEGVA